MNNQGNFPNFPTLNPGQMAGQNMQQMMGGGNANNPLMNMFQNNLQGMNQQQRAIFFENFQRNFQMMQQQSNSGPPLQQQGSMGNMNQGLHNQMLQEFMRMQGNSQVQGMMGQSQNAMGSQNPQAQGMMEQLQGIMGSGNSQVQGMMGQSQSAMGCQNPQAQGMMEQLQGIMGSGNSQVQGMMGQSQSTMGSGNLQAQGMMEQSQGIMGSGNSQNQGMMGQSQSAMGSWNPQAQRMMGQSQGNTGTGNSQIMGMQPGVSRQQGLQHGLIGNQSTISPHIMAQQSGGNQKQLHQSVSGGNKLTNIQGTAHQYSIDKTNVRQGVTQNRNTMPSATEGHSLTVSQSPFVYTKSTGQASLSNEVKQTLNEPPRLKSILKNSKGVASEAKSASVSSSGKQTLSSVQEKADKLKEMLKTYLYPEDDTTSSKDPIKKQTGIMPGSKGQTVHPNKSNTKTSPFPARSIASNSKHEANVTNSRTVTPIKGQINVVSKVSSTQSKPSRVTDKSAQQSKVEGRSIPTLVSSGSRTHKDVAGKRKAELTSTTQVKKAKVIEVEDEDPEYVQAQVYISNIPHDTSKVMILDILRHYNFESPQVWMGRHTSKKDKICAFVKLPSLKDSKRVIAEMKGFPYKGKEMEIRFSAAADFIDYTVANAGTSQSAQVSEIAAPSSNIGSRGVVSVSSQLPVAYPIRSGGVASVSSHHPVAYSAPPTDTRVAAPAVLHSVSGSAIPVQTIPTYPPIVHAVESVPSYPPPVVHPVENIPAYSQVVHTVYHGVPPPAQEIFTERVVQYPDRLYGDTDIPSRKDTDNYSEGSYRRDYRGSLSPGDRRRHSPRYSPRRDSHGSPHRSSSRDRRLSPDFPSRGRHSSLGYSPHRRYSRSPDLRQNPDQHLYRRSRSRSPFSTHSRDRGFVSYQRSRSISPGYSAGHYRSEKLPLDDRYSIRDHGSSLDFPDGRGRRSSLSPDRRYQDSNYGGSMDGSFRVSDVADRNVSEMFLVHVEKLPADIKDSELESLLQTYLYDNVRLTVRDGNAVADVRVASSGQAKIMTHELDGRRFMGTELRVDWSRDSSVREREDRLSDMDIAAGHSGVRDMVPNFEQSRSFNRERSKRSPERDRLQRSPERERSHRSTERERSKRSPERDRSRRSPERGRSQRSPERDRSRRSPDMNRSQRSPKRDRLRRSAERDRSKRSPGRDVGARSGVSAKKDWSQGARKSSFQSYIDASYPNAPILGRKYIKEFTSESSSSAYYLCILCEVTLSWKEIADHMMGYKHRLKSIRRSHPKVYDKICLIQNKVDMLGQCAKYALELENKHENIVWVDTKQPEATAIQHLKKIQGDKTPEKDRREDKKDEDDRKKKEEKKEDKSDTTSDIFKKIEAYKKKFEACKDNSEEIPAKRARTEGTKTTGLTFEDLSKQNKTLAETIEKGIVSARKGAEQKKNERDVSKKTTPAKKGAQKSSHKEVAKKSSTAVKGNNETKKVPQKVPVSKIEQEVKVADKEPEPKKEVGEKPKSVIIKVSESKINTSHTSKSKPKSVIIQVNDSKNNTDQTSKSDEQTKKVVNTESKVSAEDDVPVEKLEKTKSDVGKNEEKEKKGSTVSENDEAKVVTEENKKISEEVKRVSDKTNKINNEDKKTNDDSKKSSDEAKKVYEKTEDLEDDLVIATEDIEDLGKSISAELFSEELGDMEEEEETAMEEEKTTEIKGGPFKGKMSNNPLSKLEKYFEVRRLKDPEDSGIVGLQYVVEGIPEKAWKAHMYRCVLCNVKCLTTSIVHHITGYKHRLKYLEVHHYDIYATIIKMDQSRKVLNAECSRHAKAIEEKEGLKTVMSLSEQEFRDREKEMNKEFEVPKRENTVKKEEEAAVSSSEIADKKEEPVVVEADKTEDKPETKVQYQFNLEKWESAKNERKKRYAARIKEAKAAAKLVKFADGKETVELYKYIQQKPDVPLLGLSYITEIQGLCHNLKTTTYSCKLCFPSKKVEGTQHIYAHLVGVRHMEKYLSKHFSHKMIHLKLLTGTSAKISYLHNQAKLLCQGQLIEPEGIYVVNIAQMEQDKAALKMAEEAAKAVEEAAEAEKQALDEAKQAAMANTNKTMKKTTEAGKSSAADPGSEVIDLTAEEEKYETPTALLYSKLAGLQDIPLVGLSYITEIQGICADKVPPRYQCKLCDDTFISANYINAHITETDHRIRYLKANYPVFYSRAIGNRDETQKLCHEIEQQFGRESISVKKRILVRADGTVLYSEPKVVKAPVETTKMEQHKKKEAVLEKTEPKGAEVKNQLEEGERQECGIVFNKIIEGLDCTPMLGLQYIKEVHHPTLNYPPVYDCDVCNIKNGPFLKPKTILKHICSKDHRLNFIRENHFHLYTEILQLSTEEQRKIAIDKHTKDIESKVGRGSITKIISDKPVYWSKSSVETSLPDSKVQETSQQDDGNQIADEDQPHYKCKKCGMILAKERRVSHIIAVHMSCYKCKICQLSFPDHFYLQKHMTLIHKSKQVAPNANLNHQFKMIKWFSWHAVRGKTFPVDTSGRLQLVCKECNRVVPLGQASEHYIYDHVKGYQCQKCNAPHGSNEALEKHLQKRHNITENVPVVNYTADVQLSKMFIHVYSSKAPEFIDLTESEESKLRIGIKKYICNRCQTLFIDGNTAELHYKHCHFFEYPCTMCNYIFRIAVHLEKHYSSLHRVYRSVKTPVISFESCYHVCLENNKRMLLDAYLKEANITWKELSKTFEKAPETASTTPATNVVPKTTITTTTIPNQQSGQYVQNLTGQSSESGGPETTSRVSPDGNKSGPVNFDEILSRREDPLFDWDTEHKRLNKRMELGGIVNCARKSKFMINYTSTFSNYPLIGLQMMTEFQQKDISAEPWYMCEMCQDRINWKAITPHIVSLKHRILYLEKNHPVLHDMLKQKQFDTMESLMSKVETLAQGVVKKEGKQFSISVMLELPPSEKELKMLAEEEKIAQGTDVQLKFGFNPTAQINTGTTKESPKSKTPKQANNSAQLASSSMSTQQGENKTMEEPKKKLPAWVRIPKSSDKDNVAHDERSVSAAVTKEASSDLKPKVNDNKDSNKKQVSDSKRRDEKSGRSKERRRSKSRSRDRRSSRHSTRTRHDDKYSRDRRRRSADRDTRRDNKDDHSRKRRRSRSRDRTDSKTSRTKSPKAGSKEESRTQKGNEKNSAANKASFDKNKSNNKESAIGKHGDSNKHVSKDKELIVDTQNDTLDESETVMNVESLSIDELELISRSIEQQMEEDDDFIDIEDIVDEINPREEKSDEIVAPEKEANTDESQVKYVVENTAKENEPNLGEGQIKEKVEKNSTVNIENQTKHQVKNVVVITAKENEPNLGEGQINENVKQNSTVNIENLTKIEIDVPNQIVNKSVCEKGIVKESDAAPENCVVEIVMTSPVKKNNSESKINQVLKPHEKPIVNISIQSNENDNERSLSSNEPSAMKRSETVKNANGAPQSIKQISVPENKVEKECDITIEIKSNNEKKHEKGSENSKSEHQEIMLDKEKCVSQTTEVSIDIVDNWKPAGGEIETKSAALENTDDITMPTDFDDFIASQLGEDFVTVDDADENSPTEIEICMHPLTNKDSNIPEQQSKVDITEVSVEISESNNNPEPNEKHKTGSINRPTRDELGGHKVLDSKITNIDATESAVSDFISENEAKLKMNVDDKNKEKSEAIMIKTPKKQNLNVQNVDTTKREEKTDEIKGEQSSSVCVLEISMEPSVLETDVPKEAGVADPYDDSEDIEFMLDEEFETVDETKDNNTEEEATVINYNETEVNKEKTDQSANLDKVLPPEKNTEKMQSITTTAQDSEDTDLRDNIADTHKDIVKEKVNVANEIKKNTKMTSPENVEVDREDDNPPLGITHFPMDEDDDEDIEEIFLGGDFITVDEHNEDEAAPAIDTAEEEDFDMDFNPDDFVTVDEVDAGGTSVTQTDKPSQQKDKISTESTASSKGIDSSKNEADKCPERSNCRSREKISKDSERSSKDKSDSKKSAGSNSHSSSRRSSSRVRDRNRHSSTSTKEKRDRSNPARKRTPEKSTRSSSRSSHTSRTSTAVDKSKSRQRDNVTNSEKTGRSGSNKVSAPILSKQTIQEMAAASRSGSRSSKERLGNYTVGQDGSPKQIDTHSYLGIPIKHSTDSPLSKVNSSKVNEEKTKPEYNKDKPSLNTKSEQISISKEGGERFRPSGSKTSNSKRTDLKPNVESESVGEKSGKGSESKGGSRSSNNDGKRKKDDKVECEISIEIG